ncbi:MAG: hypothetical protein P4L57_09140 [Rhizomicrobium sp.]|nr:hypothetical protein [Rhizomicrobium sp.]
MRLLTLTACLAFGCVAAAEPITLSGSIGGKAVFFDVNRNGDTVSGWYFYLKAGQQIRLDGKIDHHGFFDIQEYSAASNSRTGALGGRIKDGHWAGKWNSAGGQAPRTLSLDPLKDNLKTANGRYHCIARRQDDDFGTALNHSLDLTLAKGRVTGLALSRSQHTGDEAPQRCALTARDLKQIPARVGIALRTRRDGGRCTLTILGAGDYLVVRPGAAGEDCRAGTKFCTKDAFWTPLVLNRKTGRCVSVE